MTFPPLPSRGSPTAAEIARLEAQLAELEPLVLTHAPQAAGRAAAVVALARSCGDRRAEGQALCLYGAALFFQSSYEEAAARFREAHALGQQLPDAALQARALNGLGNVASLLGDYAGSLEAFYESARIARESGDEQGSARVMNNIALLQTESGEYQEALNTHLQVLETATRIGDPLLISSARANAVADYHALGDYGRSLALAEDYLLAVGASGLRQHEVVVRAFRARNLLELGRVEQAIAASLEALPIAEEIAEYEHTYHLLLTLGRAHAVQGDPRQATALLTRALTLAGERGMRPQQSAAHQQLADLYEAQGELSAALRHLRAYHALDRELHAEAVDRKTRVLTAQFQVETLKREAEMERLRSLQLAQDNTALRQDRQLLAHRAAHDTLTGLPNRAHFQAEVERALGEREAGRVAVLFIDLDGFKAVNDTLGHEAGDELLRQVGARLRGRVRRDDLVGRLGGDEFTVLLNHLQEAADAQAVGRKLLEELARPFEVRGQPVTVTASIGVAVAPQDGTDVATLQRHADQAMYRAKHSGKNAVHAFQGGAGATLHNARGHTDSEGE
ncbi:diguanylate cyclase/phosphodiesterase [Deinococcus phoenicis]|uniref:Diguanylate cyclase/phosphodiesterase n=1 Tax=Deinococcus phoenicis TaxID=1476583 RepID=A0A016QNL3_9DEIO|nr:GGDEF domain-containing protein [Deinococcus phoenicis]EYB67541.1 diguanylate cyclase/phosphodiesterase [Deinococcus phoenicis]